MSDILDKWYRLINPKTVEDWGLSINLGDLAREEPEVFKTEVAPWLTGQVVTVKREPK